MRVIVVAIFAVFVGVGVFLLWLGVDLGDLGFFLEQIDDLGIKDLLLNLVEGAVVLELLGQFLRLDLLLCGDCGDLAADFLFGNLDAFLFGDTREDVVGSDAHLGVGLGVGVNLVLVFLDDLLAHAALMVLLDDVVYGRSCGFVDDRFGQVAGHGFEKLVHAPVADRFFL